MRKKVLITAARAGHRADKEVPFLMPEENEYFTRLVNSVNGGLH
jgi:hypothetical protein